MGRSGEVHDRHTPTQVSVSNAMRARDVSPPQPEDIEAAEAITLKYAVRRDDPRPPAGPGRQDPA
ncbi:MAG: hypothetical protein ABWZ26_02545 [Candidatus Nanopelagicales bacterium]